MSRLQKNLLALAIFFGLLACICMFVINFISFEVNTLIPKTGERFVFDYVIVGAGTAGSLLAAILAQKSNATILLIEAGGNFGFLSRIPLLTTFQQKGLNDWGFLSVPQKHSSYGLLDRRQCLPRGKGLGGSAQLNYMLHFDGYASDLDQWHEQHNLSNWNWLTFQPYLKASKSKPYELFAITKRYSRLAQAFQDATEEFAEQKPWRFRFAEYNIKQGLRYSVYQRHLLPALQNNRGNLHTITNALAKHVVFKNKRVQSLVFQHANKDFTVDVLRELILSAGAYQTPQLLLNSGIGEGKKLKRLGIKPQLESAQVGKNLHDHINLPLYASLDVAAGTLNQHTFLSPWTYLNYLNDGSGPLGNFGVIGHIDDIDNLEQPYSLTLFGTGAVDESVLMSISNFKRSHFQLLFPRYFNASQEGFVIISTCLQPKSRGTVSIKNNDIRSRPLIDPNYLAEMQDVNCTIRAIRAAVEVINSHAFQSLGTRLFWPKLKECANFGPSKKDFMTNMPSDRYLECLIRHVGLGSHHPGGTCRMGIDEKSSVVDSQFRLHGVKNLRIVDASVLPTPISGNPNSIITGMALRAATMILKNIQREE